MDHIYEIAWQNIPNNFNKRQTSQNRPTKFCEFKIKAAGFEKCQTIFFSAITTKKGEIGQTLTFMPNQGRIQPVSLGGDFSNI